MLNDLPKVTKSDLILEKVASKRSSGQNQLSGDKIKIVVFTLGSEFYAFTGQNIKEVLPLSRISFVPGCPDFIMGIINVRGDIESVIDITTILGLPENTRTGKSRIIIGENESIRSGILVDSVEDVVDIEKSSIHPATSSIGKSVKNHVAGEIGYNEKSVTLLDLDKIFSGVTL